jgi:ferritin
MLNDKMDKALNDQINAELHSAYIYYSMAYWFESVALTGFAKWMRIQALEEVTHAQRFAGYVTERGGRVLVSAIEGPATEWKSALDAFEVAYKHECYISDRINKLVDLSHELRDHATANFLQWFVAEQVEEEANADDAVQKLKLVSDSKDGLFMLDREFGARAFALPADMTGIV